MKKITKRIMAGIFALAMVLTMLPQVTAKAAVENETTVDQLEVQAFQEGEKVDHTDTTLIALQSKRYNYEVKIGKTLNFWVGLKDPDTNTVNNVDQEKLKVTCSVDGVFDTKSLEQKTSGKRTASSPNFCSVGTSTSVTGKAGTKFTMAVYYGDAKLYEAEHMLVDEYSGNSEPITNGASADKLEVTAVQVENGSTPEQAKINTLSDSGVLLTNKNADIWINVYHKNNNAQKYQIDLSKLSITSSNEKVLKIGNVSRIYNEGNTEAEAGVCASAEVTGKVGDTVTLTVTYAGKELYKHTLTLSDHIPQAYITYSGLGITLEKDHFYTRDEVVAMVKDYLTFYDNHEKQIKAALVPYTENISKEGYYWDLDSEGLATRFVVNGQTYDWIYDSMSDADWDRYDAFSESLGDESTYTYDDGFLFKKTGSSKLTVEMNYRSQWTDDETGKTWWMPNGNNTQSATIDIPVTVAPKINTITATGDSNVTISGSDEYLPDGAKFDIAVIKKGNVFDTVKNLIKKAIASVKNWAVYEMNLKDANGTEIHQLNGYVQVVMPIPTGLSVSDKQTLCVYRVDGDKMIACETTVKDGKVYFNTNHFSTYVVAEVPVTAADTTQQTTSPKTGENMLLFLGLGAAAVALLAASLMVAKKRYLR